MKNIAIIPARGGSKRIPRKNIRPFLGKPIIAYSIELALESGLFDEVMVSTDDDEIGDIAERYGAKVPFKRSLENADDFATTFQVINEVLEKYKQELGLEFDNACCIYPTAPLARKADLQSGLDTLKQKGFTTVFPAVAFSFPIWRGLAMDEHNKASMVWPEYKHTRSQELKPVFHDAGQWYWLQTRLIKDTLYTDNTGLLILAEDHVQDIDTITDWTIAEIKYQILHSQNQASATGL